MLHAGIPRLGLKGMLQTRHFAVLLVRTATSKEVIVIPKWACRNASDRETPIPRVHGEGISAHTFTRSNQTGSGRKDPSHEAKHAFVDRPSDLTIIGVAPNFKSETGFKVT